MVIDPRRRALAATVTALAAVALAVAVAGRGCRADEDSPEGVVRAFDTAARAGDRDAVFELLGPNTQRALTERAHRASELGEKRYQPADMVGLSAPDQAPRAQFELEHRDGDRAIVGVIPDRGDRTRMTVVRVKRRWRVELLE